jgi:uncharacterized repeat protein (TIGR04138 family)
MSKKPDQPGKHDAQSMERLILQDGRYPLDAFAFLHDGLALAVERVHGDKPAEPGQRHVSGPQLCNALRDLAIERWGMLARTVLARWRIRRTIDFGSMVYLLVDNGFMQKTPDDSLEDFRGVYDFDEAFRVEPEFDLKD